VSYTIIFDEPAIDFLNTLEKPLKERIFRKLQDSKDNPHHFFERLSERSDYKLRVGNYRAIADIDDSSKTIQETLVGHRRNIYQKRNKK